MSKSSYKIVVLPGDGIGKEVVAVGKQVLQRASELFDFSIEKIEFPCGGEYYLDTGKEWPEEAFPTCRDEADAILLGAIGYPGAILPDRNIAGAGIVFGLRFGLDLFANIRPAKLYPNVKHKISEKFRQVWDPKDVDMVLIRENTEGLYTPTRGMLSRGGQTEVAIDTRVSTRKGLERVSRFAFEYCKSRDKGAPKDGKRRVTCVHKNNVLDGCRLFTKIFKEIGQEFPEIEKDYAIVDAFTQWLIRAPEFYDVVVTQNMFGDIVTDLASVLQGGMGMAASGQVGDRHGMFEPIHGSAPKHAGKNKVNPTATVLSVEMLLEWLAKRHNDQKLTSASKEIDRAVVHVLSQGIMTYDLGGTSSTSQVGDAIVAEMKSQS